MSIVDPQHTVALDPDQAQDLAHLLCRVEDWLRHANAATFDDITHFFNDAGNGRLAVAGLLTLLGEHTTTLRRQLKEADQ